MIYAMNILYPEESVGGGYIKSFVLDGRGMKKYVEEGDFEIIEYFIDGKFLDRSFSF